MAEKNSTSTEEEGNLRNDIDFAAVVRRHISGLRRQVYKPPFFTAGSVVPAFQPGRLRSGRSAAEHIPRPFARPDHAGGRPGDMW